MSAFIEARDLTKVYHGGVEALRGLTFSTDAPIVGLIGPNGAGKTTFVRIAVGILRPTKGSVSVLGIDVVERPREVRKRVSLVPQDAYPDSRATVMDHVVYYLVARGYSLSDARHRAREVLELFGMWELRSAPCSRLSGGQRKLVIVAAALAPYEVEAAFLDEPTTGLDPANRARLWGLLSAMVREGRRILVTTHEMGEVEERVDEVVMIDRGRLVAQGSPRELLRGLEGLACIDVDEPRRAVEALRQRLGEGLKRVIDLGTTATLFIDRDVRDEAVRELSRLGLDIRARRCGLRDLFLWLTAGGG